MIPAKEAMTPMSFFKLNCSTPNAAPINSVQMPSQYIRFVNCAVDCHSLLVDVRMVELATLVYSRQAAVK